jgi:DNA-binding MarR family transcriptional regulator
MSVDEVRLDTESERDTDFIVSAVSQTATQILPRIDAELRAGHGVSLPAYAVLNLLSERKGQRLTMSELAKTAGMSPAGVTRVMQRLDRAGLVERARDTADRRPLFATLTAAGEQRLAEAGPTYASAVHQHLTRFAEPGELDVVARVLRRALSAQSGLPDLLVD